MKYVRLIRHGESLANAGAATADPELIPLTETGKEQAVSVAGSFTAPFRYPPNLIITSPFARAQATAAPTIERYQDASVEIWPVQEFTYLESSRCANTTTADRRPWVEAYWEQADPDYRDGPGVETFIDLISRAMAFLDRLEACEHKHIAVFTHGQFISAVAWLLQNKKLTRIDRTAMQHYREFEQNNPVQNCWGYDIHLEDDGRRILGFQVHPHGARCENGEPIGVCGTMLLYAGWLTLSESGREPSDAEHGSDGPTFI